ncbi:hypothetical protein B0H66DRAFT_599010 [Apodospora peruviana]|uniref:Uncharacterized protein n=1 Tax=Apodospora peruviana TaxID=516989 RepID=A0AAE0MGB8_9PEZI|nr:hypothetical protein B0H66DRAFT_599010 [Apodospora peruviana]
MFTSTILAATLTTLASAASVSDTPHDMYSSSIAVLSCYIDTNRVAYFPQSVDCDRICIRVSYGGRSVYLLRIDHAINNPVAGGGIQMDYETVPADNYRSLIKTISGKVPLTAANSINYVDSCLSLPNSWIAQNRELHNILNPTCTWG